MKDPSLIPPHDTALRTPSFQRLDRCSPYPYSPGEYARRFLWELVQKLVMPLAPRRFTGWRRFWLRLFGARLGHRCNIRPRVRIMHPWLLTMGDHATLTEGTVVYNLGPVTIGEHAVISQDAYLCAGTHDYTQPQLPLLRPAIVIGNGAWVCAGAFIGPGVTIGDNSVVAARAVVVKNVPAGVVAGGNPARVIKPRPMRSSPSER